jgi:hypothetical protein
VAKRHGVSFTTSNGKVMSSSSVSYAESVLSHLEKVQQLPIEIQVGIAKRVDTYLNVAKAANS